EKPEVIEHRMGGEPELAGDAHALGPRLHALELDPLARRVALDAIEALQKIEVPPGAPELSVGGGQQSDVLLLPDHGRDLPILDVIELAGGELPPLSLRASLLERRAA